MSGISASIESLEVVFGNKAPVWELTIDAFIKYQLKNKMLQGNGTGAFLSQAKKMLGEVENPDMDGIAALSLRYARDAMLTNEVFKSHEEEVKSVVYADLVAAFHRLADEGEKKEEVPSG